MGIVYRLLLIITSLIFFTATSIADLKIDSVKVKDISCFGYDDGEITVYISGGTPEYRYSLRKGLADPVLIEMSDWTPEVNYTFENLEPANNYWVAVIDEDGNEDAKMFIPGVHEPDELIIDITPDPAAVCPGSPLQLDGNPEGGITPYSHLWTGDTDPFLDDNEIQDPVFTSDIPGDYNLTYTVLDANDCMTSGNITITVYEHLDGGEIAESQEICYEDIPDPFTNVTSPSGGDGDWVYQWQYRVEGGDWSDIAGADELEYSVTDPLTETTDYRRLATNECGTAESNVITVTVFDPLDGGEIAESQEICYEDIPDPFTNVTSPSGGHGDWSYQWQYRVEGGDWNDIAGADELEYSVTDPLTETTDYRRLATNECGTAESNVITVTVFDPLDGGEIAESQEICYEDIPDPFTNVTSPSGGDGEWIYQWQYRVDGGDWNDIAEANDLEYAVTDPLTETTDYRRLATNDCGTTESNVITVTVYGEIDGGEIAEDQTICYEDIPDPFTNVTSPSGGHGDWSYQWQYRVEGGDWNDIAGADELEYSVTDPLTETTDYRRLATNECGTAESNVITITVFDPVDGGEIAADQTICYEYIPEPFTNVISPSGGDGDWVYQWQYQVEGGDWNDIAGADELEYSVTDPLTETTHYRRLATNECGTAESNVITITVLEEISIEIYTTPVSCFGDDDGTAQATVSGGSEPYYYIWEDNEGNVIAEGEGMDFIDNLPAGTYYLTVIDDVGCTATEEFEIMQSSEPLYANAGADANVCSKINYGMIEIGGDPSWPTGSGGEPFYDPETGEYYYEYHWTSDPHDPSLEGQENEPNPLVSPMEEVTYTVAVTDSFGCTEYDSAVIDVFPTVIADAGGDEYGYIYLCEGSTTKLGGTPLGEGPTGYYLNDPTVNPEQFTYNWRIIEPVNEHLSIDPHPEVSPVVETTYRVRVRDVDGEGCYHLDTVTVKIWDPIIVNTIDDAEICNPENSGEDITLGATIDPPAPPEGEYEYLWSADPEDPSLEGQENLLEPTVSPTTTTTYTLYVSSSAGVGCDGYDDVIITVHPEIIADAGEDGHLCDPDTETYTLGGNPTAQYIDGSTGDFTYEWIADPHDPSLEGQEYTANPEVSPQETTTYTLTVFDEFGCTELDTVTVISADEVLTAYFEDDNVEVSCYGDTYKAKVIVEGGIPTYTYEWEPEPIEYNDSIATLAAGTYTATVTDSLGCEATATITITEPDELLIDVTATDPSSVNENDGTIEVQITQETYANYDYILYVWDDDISDWEQISSINTHNLIHIFEDLGVGDYKIEVIDANGCIAEEYVTLSALDLIIESTDVTCYEYCDGTITLEIIGVNITNIEWFKNGEPYNMDPHLYPDDEYYYVDLCPGYYEVFIEDESGNENSASTTINEPDQIVIDDESIFVTDTICYGSADGEISLTAYGGTSPLYYTLYQAQGFSWEPVQGPQPNDGTFTDLEAGIYYVEVTDANECGPVTSDNLTIEELDDTYAGEDATICYGDTIQLGPESSVPGMIYEWTSNPEDTSITDPNIHNPLVSPEVTTTYILWEEYPELGCFNSDTVVITVTGEYYGKENFEICLNDTIEIGKDSIPDHEYEWVSSNPDEEIECTTSYINVSPTVTTTYSLFEYIPDTEGMHGEMCYNLYDYAVKVNPLPEADAGPNHEMCLGDTIQIGGDYNDTLPPNQYMWTSIPEDAYISDPEITNPMVSPTVTTKFIFTETCLETGCSDSDTTMVFVYPDVEATAENYGPYCEGESIELFSEPDDMLNYSWEGPDGWKSTEQNPVRDNATLEMAGIYTVTMENEYGENNLLCSITAETEVEVHKLPEPPNESFTSGDYFFCSKDEFVDPVYIGREDNPEHYDYYWDSEPEDEGLDKNSPNPLVKPDTTTIYTLKVKNEVEPGLYCTLYDTIKVEISDFELIQYDDPSLCEYEDELYLGEHLEIKGGKPPYEYEWTDIEGNTISNELNPLITRPLDPYYTLTVEDQKECLITENVFIKDIETPILELTVEPTKTPLPGQTLTFTVTPGNYHTYDFYVDDELRQSGNDTVYQTNNIKDEQKVKVIASYYGCEGVSNTITIIINDLPNAFIPDSDIRENRIFGEGVQLVVFNRWGQQLYRGNDGWDGTYRGQRVAPGTYYYVATIYDSENNRTEIKGSVTVIVPNQ